MIIPAFVAPAGDAGLLVELRADLDAAALLAASRRLRKLVDPLASISGYSSVLLLFQRSADAEEARTLLTGISVLASAGEFALEIEDKPVRMRKHRITISIAPDDALDLEEVLSRLALSREAFIRQLKELTLRVRFCGFLPGFAYLEGLPDSWNVPRRATSRVRVPRGSFAIAAGMAGFYPDDSPGGWNIIGRADATFWNPLRDPPALLSEGDVVTIDVAESLPHSDPLPSILEPEGPVVATCIHPGQQTLVVGAPDATRYKRSLSAGGAFDVESARQANRRAGNPENARVLECTLVGPELRFDRECHVAWEGAAISWLKNGEPINSSELALAPGDVLRVGRLTGGLRGWLAISGGGVAAVEAPYAAAPRRLTKGESLFRGEPSPAAPATTLFRPRSSRCAIEVTAGPHAIGDDVLAQLVAAEWIVTPSLDRTGVRLRPSGEPVSASASIPSCGMQPGTVQLHPNGELVVMGPDHPITGGYQQPFTVLRGELWKIAQLQPGERVQWVITG